MNDQEKIDYQTTVRNLIFTVSTLKLEIFEVAYALERGDITAQDAAKRLYCALDGEVSSER